MPISSNSIIHFTAGKQALKGILTDNFRLKYCRETIVLGDSTLILHVPMVSFCDIPLSQIKDHIGKYGSYGIGLTRKWAIDNNLNPVLYLEPQSHLAKSYLDAFRFFGKDKREDDDYKSALKNFADAFRYIKNYQGTLTRKDVEFSDYRFSDEREWRYVPATSSECKMLYTGGSSKEVVENATTSLEPMRLKFEPKDIKYIVINDDSEISEFVAHLRDAKGSNFSLQEVEKLTTRIMTAEQIKTDI